MILEKLKKKSLELRKSRDTVTLTSVLALATSYAKERGLKSGDYDMTEDDAIRAIQKTIKMVKDTLSLAPNDDHSKRELEILESLLPKAVSEEEIRDSIISYIGDDRDIKRMGDIMKMLTEKYGASLDKKMASTLWKTTCQ